MESAHRGVKSGMKVDNFELKQNSFKVSSYNNGREVTHEYHHVPKKVFIKLLSCPHAPEMSEVDKWVQDSRIKDNKNKVSGVISCYDWWKDA